MVGDYIWLIVADQQVPPLSIGPWRVTRILSRGRCALEGPFLRGADLRSINAVGAALLKLPPSCAAVLQSLVCTDEYQHIVASPAV